MSVSQRPERSIMGDELLQRINARVLAKHGRPPFPPVTKAGVEAAEAALGFRIPSLLKSIYTQVGDGGLRAGVNATMISVEHKVDPDCYTLVEQYLDHVAGAEYFGDQWHKGLLPFWSWGCAMYSCVGCNDPHQRIFHSDHCETDLMNYNLEEFFEMWVEDVSILGVDAAPRESKEIVNPFTGGKTRVFGRRKKK